MEGLWAYRNVFGSPGKGIHALRIGGVAAVDVLGTLVICGLISHTWKVAVWKVTLVAILVAIAIHRVFCVNTRVNVALFGVL